MDVSFISVRLILPAVIPGLKTDADLVILYKPQFELGKEWIGDGGIVRDQNRAQEHLQETLKWAEDKGFKAMGWTTSPIHGADGNIEYFFHLKLGVGAPESQKISGG
jgi:23S rRNA (cytidine1920-2'-O)/16S rRNA (cytidine1409-2'-O)-methyltransferase